MLCWPLFTPYSFLRGCSLNMCGVAPIVGAWLCLEKYEAQAVGNRGEELLYVLQSALEPGTENLKATHGCAGFLPQARVSASLHRGLKEAGSNQMSDEAKTHRHTERLHAPTNGTRYNCTRVDSSVLCGAVHCNMCGKTGRCTVGLLTCKTENAATPSLCRSENCWDV